MKTALVLGSARTVYADVEAALALGRFDGVVTCNAITAIWPGRIDAAVSLHPQRWGGWIATRDRAGLARPDRIMVNAEAGNSQVPECVTGFTELRFPGQTGSGSSGLFAVKAALIDCGFDKALICGMPMADEAGHILDGPVWPGAHHYHPAWREALPMIRGRVRSMSGWTATLLGTADADWLAQ